MARSRNIKPGFFLNDELAEIDPLGRLLFAGLWTIADREGRLEDKPKKIKAAILPYDSCDVDLLLNELHIRGFITRYLVAGVRYIAIDNWHKHQNPHKNEMPSTYPAPIDIDEIEKSTEKIESVPENIGTTPADSFNLIPDSLPLIPDIKHLSPSGDGERDHDSGAQSTSGKGQTKSPAVKLDGYTPEFEKFWKVYPRRVEKQAAFKAWKGRIKEHIDPDVLILAATNYANYCITRGTEPDFIKHPKTFLGSSKPYKDFINQEVIEDGSYSGRVNQVSAVGGTSQAESITGGRTGWINRPPNV